MLGNHYDMSLMYPQQLALGVYVMFVSACEAHGDAWLTEFSREIMEMVSLIKCSMAKCGKHN